MTDDDRYREAAEAEHRRYRQTFGPVLSLEAEEVLMLLRSARSRTRPVP